MPIRSKVVTIPIITRPLDSPLAYIHSPLPMLPAFVGVVSVAEFLQHAQALSTRLPEQGYVINLCENRYLFMVTFCAVLLRGLTNLLPPNNKVATQAALEDSFSPCCVVHDGTSVNEGLREVDLRSLTLSLDDLQEVPVIEPDHLAAIVFTSGSTGQSQPNLKTWQCLTEGARINGHYLLNGDGHTVYHQLATVPPQHMWGLEMTVMLPLMQPICVLGHKPFYPVDIQQGLEILPEPRMMVSTPIHLRALTMSGLSFATVEVIGCATSPLDVELAEAAETLLGGELREIYGCSEMGSMAIRKTTQSRLWRRFDDITMKVDHQGRTMATAAHLPEGIRLQDIIDWHDEDFFELQGRSADIINIAGKRGSLAEINQLLMRFDGVTDGVIFMPDTQAIVSRLVGLVVLSDSAQLSALQQYLRSHLDDAFIPRPLLAVSHLPREENGKLPRKQLLAFYQQQ